MYAICWLDEFQDETILTTTCLKLFFDLFTHRENLTTIPFHSWRRSIHLFAFLLLNNLIFLFYRFRRLNFCLSHFFCLLYWVFCLLFLFILYFTWFLWFLRWWRFLSGFRFRFLFRLLFNLFFFLGCFLFNNWWLFLLRSFLYFFLNILLLFLSYCGTSFSSLMLKLSWRSDFTFWLFW